MNNHNTINDYFINDNYDMLSNNDNSRKIDKNLENKSKKKVSNCFINEN